MKSYIIILICLWSVNGLAKELKYPVTDIPVELRAGSNAVIREYKIIKEIVSPSFVRTNTTYVVTIFNKSAQELGFFEKMYDQQSSISFYKLVMYDEFGVEISKNGRNKFIDIPFDGSSLFTGDRIIYNRAFSDKFPYTIEYSFTETQKQTLFIGNWYPAPDYEVAVQHASYSLSVPKDFEIKYIEKNVPNQVTMSNSNRRKTYLWEMSNHKPIKYETFMPGTGILPSVQIAANTFFYDDVPGNLSDWKCFGSWFWDLIKDRSELPAGTVTKLKQMTNDLPNDREKIKVLYKYLQDNTRYVNVSLGIGGYQPFSAIDVDNQKYGDCKALSNYMRAMLKAIGIYSIYTKIRAGRMEAEIDTSFYSQQTNHIILCVPNKGDTIWLECTSQRQPFAFQGSFTDDRFALLIEENGGKLVRTHRYTRDVNTLISKAEMQVLPDGTTLVKSSETAKAIQYENFEPYFYLDAVEQKKTLYDDLNIPNLTVNSYSFDKTDGPLPTATRKLDLTIGKYATFNGQRLMFAPKAIDRFNGNIENIKDRKYPVVLNDEYSDYDTIKIKLPQGYKVEYLPELQDLKTPFGEFRSKIEQKDSLLILTRYLSQWKGTYEPSQYQALYDFRRKIAKTDETKVVLIRE
jgi:hypothetical protein